MTPAAPTPDSTDVTVGRDDWLKAVDTVLRGRSFDDVLVSTTRDGLDILPLYTATDWSGRRPDTPGVAPFVRSSTPEGTVVDGWDVRQRHGGSDLGALNTAILTDLERGVTSIELDGAAFAAPGEGGLERVLDGVLVDLVTIAFTPNSTGDAAWALQELWSNRGVPDSAARASFGVDPLGAIAHTGGSYGPAVEAALAAVAAPSIERFPGVRSIGIDVSRYADAGATEAHELALSLATAVQYLRALDDAGFDIDAACGELEFTYSASADQFLTIAKLRAARRLWSRVADVCCASTESGAQRQRAVTSTAMMSRRDPWVNMLRTTVACFAAGVGGAGAITVLPYDVAARPPDDFGRRIARNTQLLLLEESHAAKVIDPAGGSWFVESLTDRLADEAWSIFQAIERDGGMARAVESGVVATKIAEQWQARFAGIATRREPITGVSEFPDLGEEPLDIVVTDEPTGFPIRRLAAPFEARRDAADAHTAATGQRPRVFLAALGSLATHTPRSAWIRNLLAVGGIEAIGGTTDGFESPLAAEAAFADSGCTVAVLCSSDDVYAGRAASTALALTEAGAAAVLLAGDPGEARAVYEAAGVTEVVHDGVDVVELLGRLHEILGVGS
ncbi:MAG: methylmalonyl-CoA mutase subunit beta [Acidimicrobiia bacterium]|nr:methylmalonyl-CoA mutase subunit beta [Acidimicrobiia bacterium]